MSIEKSVVRRGIAFALVAIIFFGIGYAMNGPADGTSLVSRLPLVGNHLDATPDSSANLTEFWQAWNALNSNYVITHASSTMPTTQDKLYGAIAGLAASYGDPYTVFFPPQEAKAFSDDISGTFAGVGMQIDIKNNVLTVVAPLKGTPAEAAGIKPDDEIVGINGTSTEGMSTDAAVAAIRGPVGSVVTLALVRDGQPLTVKITRANIQVPETDDGLDPKTGVYHIALYEFTSDSAQLFDEAFNRFKASGSKQLVIDLRGNPGGYLDAAVDIASHFLPKGTKIVTEDFDGKEPNVVHTSLGYDDVPPGTKVAVLVDGGSASAAEILAGALQDNHVATIIGEQTFGKGSVQTTIPLGDGLLKVTIARWITPDGSWIMEKGITPDIKVAYATSTTDSDSQMTRAEQFLTTGK